MKTDLLSREIEINKKMSSSISMRKKVIEEGKSFCVALIKMAGMPTDSKGLPVSNMQPLGFA